MNKLIIYVKIMQLKWTHNSKVCIVLQITNTKWWLILDPFLKSKPDENKYKCGSSRCSNTTLIIVSIHLFFNIFTFQVVVYPGLILKTHFAKSAFNGAPLGELVQWSDLICGLYLLGHTILFEWDPQRVDNL